MWAIIFANGELDDLAWARTYGVEADLLIAANGGARHLYRLGRRPQLLVGDSDSLSPEVAAWVAQDAALQRLTFPAAKDQTDLELALLYAVAQGGQRLDVLGALGGRLDHELANILLLAHPALVGRRVRLVSAGVTVQLWLAGSHHLDGRPGELVSLLPLGGDVWVETTAGLAWPLQQEWLRCGPSRGVSNEVVGTAGVQVTVGTGQLLVVHIRQRPP